MADGALGVGVAVPEAMDPPEGTLSAISWLFLLLECKQSPARLQPARQDLHLNAINLF